MTSCSGTCSVPPHAFQFWNFCPRFGSSFGAGRKGSSRKIIDNKDMLDIFVIVVIMRLGEAFMNPVIPPFEPDGILPFGDYEVTFDDLRKSSLVLGPGDPRDFPTWDAHWREILVDRLEILTRQLWAVGVTEVFADGSFAEDKDHPNDIDGYFVCDFARFVSGALTRELNLLDPNKVWTWDPASRRPHRGYPKKQLPMWHQYRVELYPHFPGMGLGSGIRDKHGHELEFPSAFRQSRRDGKPRGIVKIKYGGKS